MRVASVLHAALAAALVAIPAPRAAAQPADGSAAAPGRLHGRVVTRDAGRLAGVTVSLAGRTGNERRAATTDAAGAFSFEKVPPGQYTLRAAKAGYTDLELDGGRVRAGLEVSVPAGAAAAGVEIRMGPSGSMAGRILRPDGTPAPGTGVVATVRDGNGREASPLTEFRTTSEWDGRYEITDLPAGTYRVLVSPPAANAPALGTALPVDVSAAPLRFDPTLYPGVPAAEPGGTVAVHEGLATEGIDVWLMPAPQRFTVSGRVFWPDGFDVERVTIEYGGSEDVRSGVWYIDDPGGLFTLEGISRGTLMLLARAESSRGPLIGLAASDVLIGPVEEVRLRLSPPGSVSGRVIGERPLPPGAAPRVALTHTLLTVSPLYPAEGAVIDAAGGFHIPHARGAYRIDVEGLPAGWRVHRVERDGTPLTDRRLVVESEARIADLEIIVGP